MGLRINTNISAIGALRTLRINDRNQSRSLERLSTGLRINRGADDPSGLVISEQLRVQLSAMNQAVDNSQNASNLLSVADAALQEVSNLLTQIQDSIVFAQNTGGASPDQIAAEQDAVDQAISAIDRIAATTRFADRELLNGSASYQFTANIPDMLDDIHLRSVDFAGGATTRAMGITINTNPQRAAIQLSALPAAAAGGTVRITGPRGTEDVVIAVGATVAQMTEAFNAVSGFTGVYASNIAAGTIMLRSEDFGAQQLIKLEGIAGAVTATISTLDSTGTVGALVAAPSSPDLTVGEIVSDFGRDGIVTFEGVAYTGVGRNFSILSKSASFEFALDPDILSPDASAIPALGGSAGAGPFTITVGNTGLNFQLNELPLPTDRLSVGVEGVNSALLGRTSFSDKIAGAQTTAADNPLIGGFLNTVKTGSGNDLTQNANNASNIVKAAVTQVASLRGFLGAVQADAIEPNIDSLGVAIENLSASLSDLRDLDFAEETANFTRSQILFQSGIAVLASANLIPQSILTLLS